MLGPSHLLSASGGSMYIYIHESNDDGAGTACMVRKPNVTGTQTAEPA